MPVISDYLVLRRRIINFLSYLIYILFLHNYFLWLLIRALVYLMLKEVIILKGKVICLVIFLRQIYRVTFSSLGFIHNDAWEFALFFEILMWNLNRKSILIVFAIFEAIMEKIRILIRIKLANCKCLRDYLFCRLFIIWAIKREHHLINIFIQRKCKLMV
jgi:hypothetical protein